MTVTSKRGKSSPTGPKMWSEIGLLNMFMYLNEDVLNWGK